ncbi:MAG: hypothetical protein GY828_07900 [Candidatus Gracilibacteria bacterium]|nr:hypothetical protein [Candidatus Gracilibacteria bacterium]
MNIEILVLYPIMLLLFFSIIGVSLYIRGKNNQNLVGANDEKNMYQISVIRVIIFSMYLISVLGIDIFMAYSMYNSVEDINLVSNEAIEYLIGGLYLSIALSGICYLSLLAYMTKIAAKKFNLVVSFSILGYSIFTMPTIVGLIIFSRAVSQL